MHISEFASQLSCPHCGKTHGTKEWPVNGDIVPFYYQEESGKHNLMVTCPHCGKKWYVVWDNNPGTIKPLEF